jgi:hypothetical protein
MSTIESANIKLYQFVDTPYHVAYSAHGEAGVELAGKGLGTTLRVDGFRQVSVEVADTAHTHSFDLFMGKCSGTTLADRVAVNQPADGKVHTYNVVGPEIGLMLKGDANTTDNVQLWVYLRS